MSITLVLWNLIHECIIDQLFKNVQELNNPQILARNEIISSQEKAISPVYFPFLL